MGRASQALQALSTAQTLCGGLGGKQGRPCLGGSMGTGSSVGWGRRGRQHIKSPGIILQNPVLELRPEQPGASCSLLWRPNTAWPGDPALGTLLRIMPGFPFVAAIPECNPTLSSLSQASWHSHRAGGGRGLWTMITFGVASCTSHSVSEVPTGGSTALGMSAPLPFCEGQPTWRGGILIPSYF